MCVVCPFCDLGYVVIYRVEGLPEPVLVCWECDMVYLTEEILWGAPATHLYDLLEKHGIVGMPPMEELGCLRLPPEGETAAWDPECERREKNASDTGHTGP